MILLIESVAKFYFKVMSTSNINEQRKDSNNSEEDVGYRINVELENLNHCARHVNCLEKEIDEARAKYQSTFDESSRQLEPLKKKLNSSIKKTREYFELKEQLIQAQFEAVRSARNFQKANGVYVAAKETISLAELRLMDSKDSSLSAAWQDMLNHALLRVTEAEVEKSATERDHLRRAAEFSDIEKKIHLLEKKLKRSINRARPYFEAKNELELKLQQLKQTIEDLQQAGRTAKRRYNDSLRQLETISNRIHETRRKEILIVCSKQMKEKDGKDLASTFSRELSLPSFCSSGDASSTVYSDDLDTDEEYDDIDADSIFRARILSTALDDDDTSFMENFRLTTNTYLSRNASRTQSLPTFSKESTKFINTIQRKDLLLEQNDEHVEQYLLYENSSQLSLKIEKNLDSVVSSTSPSIETSDTVNPADSIDNHKVNTPNTEIRSRHLQHSPLLRDFCSDPNILENDVHTSRNNQNLHEKLVNLRDFKCQRCFNTSDLMHLKMFKNIRLRANSF